MSYDFEAYVWGEGPEQLDAGNISPWTYDLGETQGRIQPSNFPVPDGAYALCMGSDLLNSPSFRLNFGDKITFEQPVDLTGIDLLGARVRVRQPSGIPQQRELQGSPEDIVLLDGASVLLQTPDVVGQVGGGLLLAPSANFTLDDLDQEVEIINPAMGSNAGQATIIGLVPPSSEDDPITVAVLNRNLVGEGPTTGMRVLKLGARFVARIYVAGVLRAETSELPGRMRDRLDVRAHVSKLQSQHVVKLEFSLEDERSAP